MSVIGGRAKLVLLTLLISMRLMSCRMGLVTCRIRVAKCCPMRTTFCGMQRNFVNSSNANASHGVKSIAHRAGKIGACTIHFDLQRFFFLLNIHFF